MQTSIHIEQITPQLTWKLRKDVLYPDADIVEMHLHEDVNGIHFGAFKDNDLIGIISLFQNENDFQFRKFAVEPAEQKKGYGSTLLDYITKFVLGEGAERLWCNARTSAIKFFFGQDL